MAAASGDYLSGIAGPVRSPAFRPAHSIHPGQDGSKPTCRVAPAQVTRRRRGPSSGVTRSVEKLLMHRYQSMERAWSDDHEKQ